MDKDTALDLALEVLQINLTLLEKINPYKGQEDLLSDSLELTHKAITAIKQARSAPVQEPVAWIADTKRGYNTVGYECKKVNALPHGTMLYTTPSAAQRQWVGLTEQEAAECWSTSTVRTWQAIEDKLKEKNT